MNYIKWEEGKLICTHPNVERVWQYGGNKVKHEDEQPEYISYTGLIMKGGARKEFKDLKESFDEAEKYLQSIN